MHPELSARDWQTVDEAAASLAVAEGLAEMASGGNQYAHEIAEEHAGKAHELVRQLSEKLGIEFDEALEIVSMAA